MPITLKCPHPAIDLVAKDIEGTATVAFDPNGAIKTEAAATTKAKTDAEANAEKNAKDDITRQQNEIKCADDCKRVDSVPKSKITQKATTNVVHTNAAHTAGNVTGKAKASGEGTVECKTAS